MLEQGIFAGIDTAPDRYPPSTKDTTVDATDNSDNATVATMIQTAVKLALEARDAVDKKTQR